MASKDITGFRPARPANARTFARIPQDNDGAPTSVVYVRSTRRLCTTGSTRHSDER